MRALAVRPGARGGQVTDLDYYGGWLILAAVETPPRVPRGNPSDVHALWCALIAEGERRRFEAEAADLARWALGEMRRAIYG